jgi:Protein of unknown function (DUF3124).
VIQTSDSRTRAAAAILLAAAFAALSLSGCGREAKQSTKGAQAPTFDPSSLAVPDSGGHKLRGQVLYMPAYSSIPYKNGSYYDLGAFLAVHNTDLSAPISIRKADFFDTEGKLVESFVAEPRVLGPMATALFTVSQKGQKGAGANFLVEWTSEAPVSEPLIESVMKDLGSNLGISFLSQGRVVRELK